MKKTTLAVALFTASIVAGTSAFAADGTITVTGEIGGTTCSISAGSGAGPGAGPNFQVDLLKVQKSALLNPGDTAGAKGFNIFVGGPAADCPDGTKVAVLFESTSGAVDPTTGNLENKAPTNAANNVQVQIFDALARAPMDLRTGKASTTVEVASGLATLPFSAQYIANKGPAGAGLVRTEVQYSVTFP